MKIDHTHSIGWFLFVSVLTVLCAIPDLLAANHIPTDQPAKVRVDKNYDRLPLTFEANRGQADARVKFLSRGMGYTLFLTSTEAVLALRTSEDEPPAGRKQESGKVSRVAAKKTLALRIQLIDANPHPKVVGLNELPGKSNYFIGKDPKAWHANIPHYSKVRYESVYPGIDLVFYGSSEKLEYDIVVAPGADLKRVKLSFEGAERLEIDLHGDLVVHTAYEHIRQHKPFIYQDVDGVRQAVPGRYVLEDRYLVGLQVEAYDQSKPLIIDPVLDYATYLGGSGEDKAAAITVDANGNIYVTGQTTSANFPVANPYQSIGLGLDAFISKFSADGSALIYSTYLGGNSNDEGYAIAVDAVGNAYITGFTISDNFPTVNAFQTSLGGVGLGGDAFVTKLNGAGSALIYSTYLGGGVRDEGKAIVISNSGDTYVTGRTYSTDFPTTVGAFQLNSGGSGDAFVTKLDSTGSTLVYSTYLGGLEREDCYGIAVDPDENVYVTGSTSSADFPTTAGGFQTTLSGASDAFITKLDSTGSTLVYSTYLGGSGGEDANGIAADGVNNAYVSGSTSSADFPTTVGAFQLNSGGSGDAFVSKLDSTGSTLVYSTYLGGSGEERAGSIAVDGANNAYIVGDTSSFDFPTASPFQPNFANGRDAFAVKLDSDGSALIYSTYLGGNEVESGSGIAVVADGTAYVTGSTESPDFPVKNPLQANYGGGLYVDDAFVAKVKLDPITLSDVSIILSDRPDPGIVSDNLVYSLTAINNGPDDAVEVVVIDDLPANLSFVSSSPSQGTCNGTKSVICELGRINSGASATVDLVVTPTNSGIIHNTAYVTSNATDPDHSNNSANENTAVEPAADLALTKSSSPDPVAVSSSLVYTITVTSNGPETATDVVITDTLPAGVTLVSSSASQGTCSGTNTVTCNLGTIDSGDKGIVEITVVTPSAPATLNNTASVTSSVHDPEGANNSATVSTTVSFPEADLMLTKTGQSPVRVNGTLTYNIRATNNGPFAATNVVITDTLPLSMAFVSFWNISQGTCSGTTTITCNLGTIDSGDSAYVGISVEPTATGNFANTASVTSSIPDPDSTNNSATVSTHVDPQPPSLGEQIVKAAFGGGGGGG